MLRHAFRLGTFVVITTCAIGTALADTASPDAAAVAAHFRHVWASDQCVQSRGETWDDYVGWLYKFYQGADGWNNNIGAITAHITDPAVRAKRSADLKALGIRVAGEWAKDNSCRKIRTTTGFFNSDEEGKPALTDFRDELQSAAAADTGDGVRIEQAIRQISHQVDIALGTTAGSP